MPLLRDLVVAGAVVASLVLADSSGVLPKNSPSQYQAQAETDDATIAASVIPPDRAAKLFTSDVSRKYIIVELAAYPRPGHEVDIHLLDFELKSLYGSKSHPASPEEVAAVWGQKQPQLPKRFETNGRYDRGPGVGNDPPRYGTGPGAHTLKDELSLFALLNSRTSKAVAGYLYFPVSQRRKDDAPEIKYLQPAGGTVTLRLRD
jgi:hypothetical protein